MMDISEYILLGFRMKYFNGFGLVDLVVYIMFLEYEG